MVINDDQLREMHQAMYDRYMTMLKEGEGMTAAVFKEMREFMEKHDYFFMQDEINNLVEDRVTPSKIPFPVEDE